MRARSCLFPLRTNAGFYRNDGYLRLYQRVKEAAFLYDTVILDEGVYTATIGPAGALEMMEASSDTDRASARKLKPSGGSFSWQLINDRTGQAAVAREMPAERRFVGESGSIVAELLREAGLERLPKWLKVQPLGLGTEVRGAVSQLARDDVRVPGLWRRKGSTWLRDVVLRNLNHDLVLGAGLRAAVSMDGYFAPLVARKAGVNPIHGRFATQVVVPNFGGLPWGEILELREHPGMESFRSKMQEIEEEELTRVETETEAREAIHRRIEYDLTDRWRAPGGIEIAGKVGVDLALSLSPVPLVGATVGTMGEVVEAGRLNSTWAAFFRVFRDTARRHGL